MVTITKKQLKELKGSSKLKDYVINDVLDSYNNYDDIDGYFKDLFHGGCQSGFVGSLIYCSDTVKYFDKYKDEIEELITTSAEDQGVTYMELISSLNNAKYIDSEEQRKNLLAWFAFEETAHNLANELGLEI